ncbi:glutaredoxin family protein [Nocardioides taihuensis]|uniref:Glutaredoxin family protein n=1 Tax=Nocardioides taihuensis TaxID=1835606 RepID=A0ABW0BHA9_9ACTN
MSERPSLPPVDPGTRVVVLVRVGCHLCEDARGVVAAVCEEVGERFVEVDVDADADLQASYGDEVPVTFVDGRQHDFWRVDAARLRAALAPDAPG